MLDTHTVRYAMLLNCTDIHSSGFITIINIDKRGHTIILPNSRRYRDTEGVIRSLPQIFFPGLYDAPRRLSVLGIAACMPQVLLFSTTTPHYSQTAGLLLSIRLVPTCLHSNVH